ncbi:MAG: ATP-binding cassette domain-containing protein [Parachlamydia sp.]|nr:ATP-binding cassette domain-containing protein [Parachlamydia sp.]
MAETVIKAHDVWKSYGKLQVLKGLNLDVFKGETLVILGRSGVGKSVLLKQILGIETPEKGYIEVSGQRISAMSQSKRYEAVKHMGMLFQGAALFDSMTVGENVAFYLRQHEHQLNEEEISKRVGESLEMVDLAGTQGKMPSDLSGGMRKRAALARLIVYRPLIILYDEPTTGLDPITAAQINELINKTKKELQATSIVVTHDIRSAMDVGDRLAFHHDGKIAQIAPKEEFLKIQDPLLHQFFENAIIKEQEISENSHG